jgi:hypothetical protein
VTSSRVTGIRLLVLLVPLASASVRAAELKPETAAAFDRYIKVTEEQMNQHRGFRDFLWLDHRDAKEKSLVWLGQPAFAPLQTLDHGQAIDVPDGVIQHWLGAIYLDEATLERTRDLILNFADYKNFFKQQVIDSKLIKRDGDQFDFLLRLYKKQISAVLLNVNETAQFTQVDASKILVACRSTHIGEVSHPNNKKAYDDERTPEDEAGYLWRLNLYYRLEQSDNGVYVELEVISLGREAGGKLSAGRFLTGFETFPRELTHGIIDGLHDAFPHHR